MGERLRTNIKHIINDRSVISDMPSGINAGAIISVMPMAFVFIYTSFHRDESLSYKIGHAYGIGVHAYIGLMG